ncbi:monovalent cation/H+ antiporter subunit D family protein [Paracoccaceae bacterium]|jgi:multicomponent Na+:H+ antiporter subunit D|nr:monovalent cation/H+ antiporter subunit D family protein [Paracoccaceae bacterium]MDC0108205.1 monovalent cation/H+ antiporter subunit D family protein [Paracoccaceae bacterium]MDC0329141.1 monovalent cation/H+ antiporter subunit D family protein [bacterium]MDG1299461.1 monovalent cation/H+ antiporter subunit D family protein [Paracoccaceae bacterium]MDG2374682.1 monovalent cation/H+ antiporter subunit D family protein [Paracoccaceae bacterium]|tara:strand:- start:1224 stop:2735 length:1512 start_codon:yes stop_codon:yes gene_type:complete
MSLPISHSDSFSLVEQLPILQILVPFVSAPLIVFIGNRTIAWWITFLASLISLLISINLLLLVNDGSIISYHIGGWAPPIGIEYRVDALNAFVLVLITLISTIVAPYAYKSVGNEIPKEHHTLFYAAYLLCVTGLMGVVITGDVFNVFVFLEISSLASYVLISLGSHRDKRALTSAFNYLIIGTIGATFFVIGIGLLYMVTGTLNMIDMAGLLEGKSSSSTVRSAFAFIIVGVGLKLAIYPLHIWLPKAYTFAPSFITAFLAATATKVAIYILLRFMFTIFRPSFLEELNVLNFVILPLSIAAMIIASMIAIFQKDFKGLLAYSSIAQVGYILLGISIMSESGLTAAIIHLFNHGITKVALFMVAGAYVIKRGGSLLTNLQGAGFTMPWTSAATVVGCLSLIGVPGTAGFISKWILVEAAIENGKWPLAIVIIFSSLLAVVYCGRLIETLYFKNGNDETVVNEAPLTMLISIWIASLACIYFGLSTDITISVSDLAAKMLYLK